MKRLISAIVIAPLALAAALPAAGQTLRTPQQSTPIRLAAISDTERTTYTEKARAEMLVWQQKLHDFGERSKVKATDAQTKATNDLNQAWANTKAASARLETAAAEAKDVVSKRLGSARGGLAKYRRRGEIGHRFTAREPRRPRSGQRADRQAPGWLRGADSWLSW
jgi:hypothetical protein